MSLHPASSLSVSIISRGKGHSAVAAAAYRSRSVLHDERTGLTHDYRRAGGLLSHEVFQWEGSIQDLWAAAEAAERHPRACVARELRVALPAELELADQVRLVRGMCCWLRDTYGVAVQADVHAPRFHDPKLKRRLEVGPGETGWDEYLQALFDPTQTNLNFHAHIQYSSRKVDPATGTFGPKTRVFDDPKTGPGEVLRIRQEWEKRANALLAKRGHEPSIDMRSHVTMIAAGDAPAGLEAQDHLGPKATARGRRSAERHKVDMTRAGIERRQRRRSNERLWTCWEQIRAAEREKARLEESIRIARDQEAARLADKERERQALAAAGTKDQALGLVRESFHFHHTRVDPVIADALVWALQDRGAQQSAPEFGQAVDPETYDNPDVKTAPWNLLRVVRKPPPGRRPPGRNA